MLIEIPAAAFNFPGEVIPEWLLCGYDYESILQPVWSEQEAGAMAPPPDLTVSEWSDTNRVLRAGISRKPGPWRTDYTPYLRKVMDAYTMRSLHNLVFCAGTQLGKTECLYNILGYIIDHEPYPTMMVSPREDDAKMVSRTRIQPMVEDCEALRAKKPVDKKDFSLLQMKFPGMYLYLVGANSPAAMASKPARNILRDEKDKYRSDIGADAKTRERAKSFWDIRKIIDVSSPSFLDHGILKDLVKCEVINVIKHPCPHCYIPIRLYFPQIQFDDRPGDKHRRMIAKQSAYYACQECGSKITDDARPWMIANHVWVEQDNIEFGIENDSKNHPLGKIDFEPERVGFWISSLSSPMLTWGDIVAEFIDAMIDRDEKGDTVPLQNFVNDWLAEPWKENVKKSTAEEILQRKGELAPLVAPEWAYALTCGIDVQKHGFWFTVWAFSRAMRSALIHYGYLTTYADLFKLVFQTTFAVSGREGVRMPIWRAAMDIGGGKDSEYGEDWTKTEEIVTWIRENGQGIVHPIKGMSKNATGQKIRHSIMDKMPGQKGGIIPGGLVLWLLDTYMLKENVFWRFECGPNDAQPLELHRETGMDFALQMTAWEKQRNKNGVWEYVPVRTDDHLGDASVYAHAAADFQWMGGVNILEHPIYAMVAREMRHEELGNELRDPRGGLKGFKRPGWLKERRR
jgi:phage terminase large subunit GpA-like protein